MNELVAAIGFLFGTDRCFFRGVKYIQSQCTISVISYHKIMLHTAFGCSFLFSVNS